MVTGVAFAALGNSEASTTPSCLGFGVWGLGFGVWGLGFRACELQNFILSRICSYGLEDSGVRVQGLGFGVSGCRACYILQSLRVRKALDAVFRACWEAQE